MRPDWSLSDWLEEHGEFERAAVIRRMVKGGARGGRGSAPRRRRVDRRKPERSTSGIACENGTPTGRFRGRARRWRTPTRACSTKCCPRSGRKESVMVEGHSVTRGPAPGRSPWFRSRGSTQGAAAAGIGRGQARLPLAEHVAATVSSDTVESPSFVSKDQPLAWTGRSATWRELSAVDAVRGVAALRAGNVAADDSA